MKSKNFFRAIVASGNEIYCWWTKILHQLRWLMSQGSQLLIHPRWCRVSPINSYHPIRCHNVIFANWFLSQTLPFPSSNCNLNHDRKPSYFPLYWLVNRDPYNGFGIIPIKLGNIMPYIQQLTRFFSLLTWQHKKNSDPTVLVLLQETRRLGCPAVGSLDRVAKSLL